ncbi:MAG: glucuronate isomerase [Sulfobacillus thermosulfidooxidans]|nr:MAG: glucuronate isomerase [Sulfobacillus thermosulfidooxidans]
MDELERLTRKVVRETPATDIHTHLFSPEFGTLLESGIDAMLSYHYLIAESFRVHHMIEETFWQLSLPQRAEHIWRALFESRLPLSEAATGVLVSASQIGVPRDALHRLDALRQVFTSHADREYVRRIMNLAGVQHIVMTNDPLNPIESSYWNHNAAIMDGFHASLRLDTLLNQLEDSLFRLREQGYDVTSKMTATTVRELWRLLDDWNTRYLPVYVALSVSDAFVYPACDWQGQFVEKVLLPWCQEHRMPWALMMGVERGINPALREAGDGVVRASLASVVHLCQKWPENKFLVTALSREDQYALTVVARKFHNLMLFGAWWFLNTRSFLSEITRMRLELLGSTFIVQHSDARVLEQLIYKWALTREVLTQSLLDRYRILEAQGWSVTEEAIQHDVALLLTDNFWHFVGSRPAGP